MSKVKHKLTECSVENNMPTFKGVIDDDEECGGVMYYHPIFGWFIGDANHDAGISIQSPQEHFFDDDEGRTISTDCWTWEVDCLRDFKLEVKEKLKKDFPDLYKRMKDAYENVKEFDDIFYTPVKKYKENCSNHPRMKGIWAMYNYLKDLAGLGYGCCDIYEQMSMKSEEKQKEFEKRNRGDNE